ncbi:hypothetical protein PQR39_35640 [Paraburkholderia sediminicola]|uniref:hypothetical protein n=1 Tax=Paraburkholderia sediminicola TaxID=458836 RepID=UPI0038B76541
MREPGKSDTSHLKEFESDGGKYVEANEAIRREKHNAERIADLQAKLNAAHAVGSNTEHVDTTELFAKLRKLADEAWPKGPLRAERNLNWAYPQTVVMVDHEHWQNKVMRFVNGTPQFSCTIGKAKYEWRNADFFAAASPEVVLFLLDHINALGAKIERLETAYQNVAVTRLNA